MAVKPAAKDEPSTAERGPAPESPPEPEVVTVDTLIERTDLGPGCSTLVAAGHPIPAELADLPRRPRDEPEPESVPKRKAKTVRLGR